MQKYQLAFAVAATLVLAQPAWAQTANSSGGAGSATQSSSGATAPQSGSTAPGSANGQNSQVSSGGTSTGQAPAAGAMGGSKIGAPTPVEQQEQQKSEKDTQQICKGC